MGLSIQKLSWREWPKFAPVWDHVHSLSPEGSFFVSQAWIDTWLAIFGPDLNPDLLLFQKDADVVGCCLLVWRTQLVRGIPMRQVYLNCAGEGDGGVFVEFNTLVCLPDFAVPVAEALAGFLRKQYWDEFLVPGTLDHPAIRSLLASFDGLESTSMPSRFVKFAPLRTSKGGYMDHLSAKTRHHIRRTRRAFEEAAGECGVRMPENAEDGVKMLNQLADLHQARWEDRGESGAFSSARFRRFHETLVRNHFDKVLLFHVHAGEETIGFLYCFVHRGWVYYYQSGFSYKLDRRSPGLLTLFYVISRCMELPGLEGFDFMAGDVEYKRSLTAPADYQDMQWTTIRRKTPSSLLYMGLRRLKRKYVEIRGKGSEGNRPPDGDEPPAELPVSDKKPEPTADENPRESGS